MLTKSDTLKRHRRWWCGDPWGPWRWRPGRGSRDAPWRSPRRYACGRCGHGDGREHPWYRLPRPSCSAGGRRGHPWCPIDELSMSANWFPSGVRGGWEHRSKKLTIACSAKARISLIALGARFLKLTPWHYNSGKEVAISLPPECHLLEKTLRDECFWSFGHSGLHKTNSSFVFRVRICVDASEDFFKISSRLSLSRSRQKTKVPCPTCRFLHRSWWGWWCDIEGDWFPIPPSNAHTHQPTPHTFFSVTNSILQEKFLVLCPLYASRTESYSNRRR